MKPLEVFLDERMKKPGLKTTEMAGLIYAQLVTQGALSPAQANRSFRSPMGQRPAPTEYLAESIATIKQLLEDPEFQSLAREYEIRDLNEFLKLLNE